MSKNKLPKKTAINKLNTFLFGKDLRITDGEPYSKVRQFDFSSYLPYDEYIKKEELPTENVYNIIDYYVKANDFTFDNAPAINKAIADASKTNGTVIITGGEYNSTTIKLISGVTLFIDYNSAIVADKSGKGFSNNALVFGKNLCDITITGGGKLKCNGEYFGLKPFLEENMTTPPEYIDVVQMRRDYRAQLRFAHSSKYGGPICLEDCKNVKVNNFTIENSAYWTFRLQNCENVYIKDFVINNNRNVANSDGLDIVAGKNLNFDHVFISTADDGVVIKNAVWLGSNGITDSITLTNSEIISRTNAIKIGTETTNDIKNIFVSDCKLLMTDLYPGSVSGISIEACDGSTVSNVEIKNIYMDRCTCPIFIRVGNRNRASEVTMETANAIEFGDKDVNLKKKTTIPKEKFNHKSKIFDINFENIVATGVELPIIIAGYRQGLTVNPVTDINMNNIKLQYSNLPEIKDRRLFIPEYVKEYPECWRFRNLPSYAIWIRHAKDIKITNFSCTHPQNTWKKDIILKDTQNVTIK